MGGERRRSFGGEEGRLVFVGCLVGGGIVGGGTVGGSLAELVKRSCVLLLFKFVETIRISNNSDEEESSNSCLKNSEK